MGNILKMTAAYFVTGTDTEVGKTFVSSALLARARGQGLSTAAIKPIASGAELINGQWRNEDGLALWQQCSLPLCYEEINPILFKPAIAPHIAAQQAKQAVSVNLLAGYCQRVLAMQADFTLIEGAGGWRVPVNETETLADLAKELNLPVILVVGMRLGCINHAILSAEAILRDGLSLAGWVANRVTSHMNVYEENLATLERLLPAPCIGRVPFVENHQIDLITDCFTL